MSSPAETSLPYLLERLPARWAPLLVAFASELVEQMGTADGRAFLRLLGQRVAREANLTPAESTLGGWLDAANAWLDYQGWGHVRARENGHHLDVTIAPTPLNQAFGPQAQVAAAIYEGLLAYWFEQAGASGLVLDLVEGPATADGRLTFILAAPTGMAGHS